MILADTSVWIHHFRAAMRPMQRLLEAGQIVAHPLVIAEIALGSIKDRRRTLAYLDFLPEARVATTLEVRRMIEAHSLHARGIGLVDAHLLAAALLTPPTRLWTLDKRLQSTAASLGIAAVIS